MLPVATSTCRSAASCAGTADEIVSTIGYGPQTGGIGNNLLPVSVTTGSGDGLLAATTTTSYDAAGNPILVDGPLPGSADTTRTLYDGARRVIGVIGPDPDGSGPLKHRASRETYSADGLHTRSEVGITTGQTDAAWAAFQTSSQTDFSHDAAGRETKVVQSAADVQNSVLQKFYANGLLSDTVVRIDPSTWGALPADASPVAPGPYGPDRITHISRDDCGRPIATRVAVGTDDEAQELTAYDDRGNVSSVTDGEGNVTAYQYDSRNRLKRTTYSPSFVDFTEFTYDAAGNVLTERLRDGQVIGYGYDALGRKVSEDRSGVGIDQDLTYTYDLQGKLLSAIDAGGQHVEYQYDALGRMYVETNMYGGFNRSQYDLAGRRTRLRWNDNHNILYDRLVTGEVSAIREGATSGGQVLASYAYDDLGRRVSVVRGNGTSTSYAYDGASRLASLSHDFAGTAKDVSTTFSYNPAGQVVSSTRNNDAYAWTGHYDVDRAYGVNGLNQLTFAGTCRWATTGGAT